MKKQMKLCTLLTKPFVLFVLLFALGVGTMWGWNVGSDWIFYFDMQNCQDFGNPWLRIGRDGNNNNYSAAWTMDRVEGTKWLYYKQPGSWDNYGAFSVANKDGWTAANTIYQPYNDNGTIKPNDTHNITKQTNFQKYEFSTNKNCYLKITANGNNTNSCQYYQVNNHTNNDDGGELVELPMYSVTFNGSPTHGTVSVQKYTKTDGSTKSPISTGDEVYPTQIIEITTTPDTHYALATLTVTGATLISGTTYYVTGACEIAATFDHKWTIKGSDSFAEDDDGDEMGDWKVFNGLPNTGTNTYSGTISLAAHTAYYFKVYDRANSTYYGCGTRHNDYTFVGQTDVIPIESPGYNLLLLTTQAGTYTFEWNDDTKSIKVIYPNTVVHPSYDYVYIENYTGGGAWGNYYVHYFYDDGGEGETMTTWGSDNPHLSAYTSIGGTNYYYIPILTTYPNFIAKNQVGDNTGSHETSKMYTSGHAAQLMYWKDETDKWTWKDLTVHIGYDDRGANTNVDPTSLDLKFNSDVLTDLTSTPLKDHYDFGGFYTNSDGTGTQLIDASGNWIASVSNYTDASKHWIHEGTPTTIYAKWTEHEYTITTAVSPAGAGSINVGESTKAKYVTASGDITATANAGWVFKEWQFSHEGEDYDVYVSDGSTYHSTDATIRVLADHDGTLTAVFEPRYYLVGKIWDDSADGGMPGWANYSKPFKVVTTSPVLDTCKLTLSTDQTFYIMVLDKADGYSYGKADSHLGDGDELVFSDKDNKVMFYSNGGTEYTFKITAVDGSGRPTVSVERPYQVNVGRKRVDIDGNDHDDNTGGTVAMSKTVGGDAVANGAWVPYGTSVKYDASTESGYSLAWFTGSDYASQFSTDATFYHIATSTGNGYAKFTENATTVTLSATNGQIKVGDTPSSETTCGVTTTRSLTAVPNDGYYFTGWSLSSSPDFQLDDKESDTDPEVTLRGKGDGNAGTLTANFALRYSVKGTMNSENWGTDHIISNIETVGGKVIGYVEMTLSANTSYEFAIYDLANGNWLKNNNDQVYYMTNGNSYVWGFDTDKTKNCGITTAGAGTYRFMWNITDKTMSVIYPNFVIYRSGDKDEDTESATHTITTSVESYDDEDPIAQGIEFRMKVRELNKWYTLCLPFTVNKVCVWDAEDGKYYEMKPYYRSAPGETFYTGHYVIRSPYGEGVEDAPGVEIELKEFGDWRDPVNASVLPSASTPYIIQWHHSYFQDRYISFFGATGQTIRTSMTSVEAPSVNDKVRVCGNDAMKEGEVAGAYLLDNDYGSGAWLRDEKVETVRTILPFECYIIASDETTGRYLAIRRGMTTDDTPTGWDDVLNSERKQIITVYTLSGFQVTQYNDCSFNQAAQRLHNEQNEGIFILRSENESIKLMVGGK